MESAKIQEFVIFDVETTGLSPRFGDRIIEIAAVKVKGLKPVEKFQSFINPQRRVSPGAYNVNRISDKMLTSAPQAADILPEFMKFISTSCLVGHNISFDLGFLKNELLLMGKEWDDNILTCDTLQLSRKLLPELPSHSLSAVSYSLGNIEIQEHRAMSDVEMTFDIFVKLLEIADRRDICKIEEIFNL